MIPAYNEEKLLPRLLDTVDEARRCYPEGTEEIEVVVSNNGSTDRTAEVASARGCRIAEVEKRIIGAVRNGGARIARGKVLSFVDADARLHPETFLEIDEVLSDPRILAGTSGVRLERWSLGIAATFAFMYPVVLFTQIDTGVLFCYAEDFDEVGGFDERRQFGEDMAFMWALKHLGRQRGQALRRLRRAKSIFSLRKFDEFGDWHYITHMWRFIQPMFADPDARSEFADRYWYADDRKD